MESVVVVGAGLVLVLAWVCVKWRREVELDKHLEALAVSWDSLTEGQRARRVQMRDATIGEIIRELPPVDSGTDSILTESSCGMLVLAGEGHADALDDAKAAVDARITYRHWRPPAR